MKHVITGTLDIAYLEVGPPDGHTSHLAAWVSLRCAFV